MAFAQQQRCPLRVAGWRFTQSRIVLEPRQRRQRYLVFQQPSLLALFPPVMEAMRNEANSGHGEEHNQLCSVFVSENRKEEKEEKKKKTMSG